MLIAGAARGPGGEVGEGDEDGIVQLAGHSVLGLRASQAGNPPQRNSECPPAPAPPLPLRVHTLAETQVSQEGLMALRPSPTSTAGQKRAGEGDIVKPGPEEGKGRGTKGGRRGAGGAGAPDAPVRSEEAASARDSKTSVMCHSPLLADCSWIKD